MLFSVAPYVPGCRKLEVMPSVRPQLCADNLQCSAECPRTLCGAARFTAQFVRSVGQDVSPGKCVLLSTSESARKAMNFGMYLEMVGFGRFSWMFGILGCVWKELGQVAKQLFLVRSALYLRF